MRTYQTFPDIFMHFDNPKWKALFILYIFFFLYNIKSISVSNSAAWCFIMQNSSCRSLFLAKNTVFWSCQTPCIQYVCIYIVYVSSKPPFRYTFFILLSPVLLQGEFILCPSSKFVFVIRVTVKRAWAQHVKCCSCNSSRNNRRKYLFVDFFLPMSPYQAAPVTELEFLLLLPDTPKYLGRLKCWCRGCACENEQ